MIPVYNEQRVLADSIHRLHEHLATRFDFPFQITIADNASTDGTLEIAESLADALAEVEVLHLPLKGRGRALRAAWSHSEAQVVQDESWFFDTELLYLAQRNKLAIHEVPVHWVDDPDSRVDIIATAREDLRGIRRLRAAAAGSSQEPTASGRESRSWRSPSTAANRGSRTLTATPMAARTRAAAIQKARR